jgi:hypothetical protein
MKAVWCMTLCTLIDGYQRFKGTVSGDGVVGMSKESHGIYEGKIPVFVIWEPNPQSAQ